MCDLPGCPAGDEPLDVTSDNEQQFHVECTSAATQIMKMFRLGWTNGTQGVLSDISEKWGFPGITRVMYSLCGACAVLPRPDDVMTRATPQSIREKLARVTGEEVEDQMVTSMMVAGDQVFAAFEECVALARQGDKTRFTERFDEVTDQENMLHPLVSSAVMVAGASLHHAERGQNTSALDQLQTFLAQDLDLDEYTGRRPASDLQAMFDLPDADRRD
jgi:hypothetical protein